MEPYGYYEKYKEEVKDLAGPVFREMKLIEKTLLTLVTRIDDEKSICEGLAKRREKVKNASGDLSINKLSSFRNNLKKIALEEQASEELLEALRGQRTDKEQELKLVKEKLLKVLTEFAKSVRHVPEERITSLIGDIVAERDAHMTALETIHGEYETVWKAGQDYVTPRARHDRCGEEGHEFLIEGRNAPRPPEPEKQRPEVASETTNDTPEVVGVGKIEDPAGVSLVDSPLGKARLRGSSCS